MAQSRTKWTGPKQTPRPRPNTTVPVPNIAQKLEGGVNNFQCSCGWVHLGCSGVPQPDSVSVLLLIILAFSADSVSLSVAFNSCESLQETDPEFSLESLSKERYDKQLRCLHKIHTLHLLRKQILRMMTHSFLAVCFFCLVRSWRTGGSKFISFFVNSSSPAVSRFFAMTQTKC